jgi:hypothetical protein
LRKTETHLGKMPTSICPDSLGAFGSLPLYDVGRLRPFRTLDDVEADGIPLF